MAHIRPSPRTSPTTSLPRSRLRSRPARPFATPCAGRSGAPAPPAPRVGALAPPRGISTLPGGVEVSPCGRSSCLVFARPAAFPVVGGVPADLQDPAPARLGAPLRPVTSSSCRARAGRSRSLFGALAHLTSLCTALAPARHGVLGRFAVKMIGDWDERSPTTGGCVFNSSRRTRRSAARWLFGLPRFMARWRPRPEHGVPERCGRRLPAS